MRALCILIWLIFSFSGFIYLLLKHSPSTGYKVFYTALFVIALILSSAFSYKQEG